MPHSRSERDILQCCQAVELLVLDVDGVLTDGRIILDDNGVESKHFCVRDGTGIDLWRRAGKHTAILSGRRARVVERRAAELSISPVVQGAKDKLKALVSILERVDLTADRVCYVGDDLPDLPVIALAGCSACPGDAVDEVRAVVDFVAQARGGHGAVREIVEWLLKAQSLWDGLACQLAAGRS